MVFQHFSLFETLTVAENIALRTGYEEHAGEPRATHSRSFRRATDLPIDPQRLVHSMSVGERQRVEIVRCLLQSPRLLIMDEPTSVLTPQAVPMLFATLRRLAAEHVSILYISHKLDEVRALCDYGNRPARRARQRHGDSAQGNEREPRAHDGGRRTARVPADAARRLARRVLSLRSCRMASSDPFGTHLQDIRSAGARWRDRRHRGRLRQRATRAARGDLG